jgi:hypothetical protein
VAGGEEEYRRRRPEDTVMYEAVRRGWPLLSGSMPRRVQELLSTMGFQRLERPDPQDAEAILQMYRRGRTRSGRLRLRNTFGCAFPGGHLYAVRRYLTPGVREALLAFRFMSLVAEGDAFALQVNPFMGPKPGDEVGALRGLVEEAGRMARALEEASPSSARKGREGRG